jgi:RNA polymerase sigma-70 factor (ECF subfamily)
VTAAPATPARQVAELMRDRNVGSVVLADDAGRPVGMITDRDVAVTVVAGSGDAGVAAEDLASETWLTAARRIADFRGSSDDFAGWLFGIARLQARNAVRRTSRRRTSPATAEALDLTHPDRAPAAHDLPDAEGWVSWLLSHLPERERQVVACLDVVGLDVASTAAALGMSGSAVRVAHHRGLKKLRALGADVS